MIKRLFFTLCVVCLGFQLSAKASNDLYAEPRVKNLVQAEYPLFLVHYMPWYQSPEVSGYWGWHWTMNHFDPAKRDEEGHRQIASHYYPLTGPYDSNDDDILEYQVLLMKISGVDGVIVDWYGTKDFRDYPVIQEATRALAIYIDLAELLFSICYEDQTIGHMVDEGVIDAGDAIDQGKTDMQYLKDHWFNSGEYLMLDNRPVLFTFGPQYFHASSDWVALFSDLNPAPLFFTLDNRLAPVAAGAYPWPPMWASVNDTLSQNALNSYLSSFYQKAAAWDYLIAGAFPAFNDIYEEAELGYGYGILDPREGATFESTLQTALDQNPDVVQIITWNDYGEGTIIEPTVEFGFQYLEMIQDFKINSVNDEFIYTAEDLDLPLQIYHLRKQYQSDSVINSWLDDVFDMIVFGEIEAARTVLDSLNGLAKIESDSDIPVIRNDLLQNYPNPFNPATEIRYQIPKNGKVRLSVYNVSGQKVTTLINKYLPAGIYQIQFQAQDLPAGIYFSRLEMVGYTHTRKMILLP